MAQEEDKNENESAIVSENKLIEAIPGKPLMIFKLGSESRGWIPGKGHYQAVRDYIQKTGLDKEYNILLYHFGIQVQIVHPKPWYKRIFG